MTARLTQFYSEFFDAMGLPVLEIHSRKSQSARTKASDAFRAGSRVRTHPVVTQDTSQDIWESCRNHWAAVAMSAQQSTKRHCCLVHGRRAGSIPVSQQPDVVTGSTTHVCCLEMQGAASMRVRLLHRSNLPMALMPAFCPAVHHVHQ